MAAKTKPDLKAAKEAKQKKLLIVLGVVLLALMAWQLPKLMGGNDAAAAPAATAPVAGDPAAAADRRCLARRRPRRSRCSRQWCEAEGRESQLASFSLFEAKDPFVQKIVEKTETAKAASGGTVRKGRLAAGAGGGGDHRRWRGTHPGSRVRVRDDRRQR